MVVVVVVVRSTWKRGEWVPPNLIRQAAERITPESTRDSAAVDAGCVGPCTPQSPIDSVSGRERVLAPPDEDDSACFGAVRTWKHRGSACASWWWWTLRLNAECLANLNGK